MKKVLLFTNNVNTAREEIERANGKISQQFSEELFIAELPDDANENDLKNSTGNIPENLAMDSQLAYNAWNSFQEKSSLKDLAPDAREGLAWDTEGFEPPRSMHPLIFPDDNTSMDVQNSSNTPTSLYLIGSVAVGIVIVSGPGDLAITQQEAELIISEVQEGLNFLANAEPRARVSFVYDIRVVSVNAMPGSTSSYETAEAPWRNEALGKMGFPANRQGSIQYVNALLAGKGTEWAYVAYFTKYPLHHFAYAVDEKLVMSYYNDGWGPEFINGVFAHETCHIFGAADEYGTCSCNSIHGYLSIPNNNCRQCAPASVDCLMDRNKLTLCEWSRKQIGWDNRLLNSTT